MRPPLDVEGPAFVVHAIDHYDAYGGFNQGRLRMKLDGKSIRLPWGWSVYRAGLGRHDIDIRAFQWTASKARFQTKCLLTPDAPIWLLEFRSSVPELLVRACSP
jgi:hypothetical protein